ncbi:HER135Cp [Eremothecium sinecaudum]|uniref:HER135Cp n=1 Tax=Eremothecium sinecaudum TaxID=45286 RepID=A0A0X8HU03_9SACH|nr:HER135Cp [Eremothecium sinecaudum]AMD21414.1 HER135Cp [Eremothecium sinecaudum]
MALHEGPLDEEDQVAVVLDARSGDLDGLREIFTKFIHPKLLIECKDPETKSTPLHMAAANGHLEVIKYMLSIVEPENRKEWVNLQNQTGNTALHWATLNGHLDVVKLLCDEHEADPFIKNQFGFDAIYEAESKDKEEIETYYLTKYDVQPEDNENDDEPATTSNVQISEGTEIEQVTKEATEVLNARTADLSLSK